LAATIKRYNETLLRFIRYDVLSQNNSASNGEVVDGDSVPGIAGVVSAALRLWTSLALADMVIRESRLLKAGKRLSFSNKRLSSASSSSSSDRRSTISAQAEDENDGNFLAPFVIDLLNTLFDGIKSMGQLIGGVSFGEDDTTKIIRFTCVTSLLSVIHIPSIGGVLPVGSWNELAWAMLDEDKSVRASLLGVLSVVIQTQVIHPRYLAFAALFASDESLAAQAQQALKMALNRLRRTHSEYMTRALQEDSDELRHLAEYNMPEQVLPYLIYLLSYHPQFPTNPNMVTEDDKAKGNIITQSLKMMISTLCEGNGDATNSNVNPMGDNLSYLLKQVNTITRYYRDREDPSNIGLHFAARVAIGLLNASIRTTENVQPYPGDIELPNELFDRMHGKPHSKEGGMDGDRFNPDKEIMKQLENSEKAIANLVQANKGGKFKIGGAGIPSPVKMRPGAAEPKVKAAKKVKVVVSRAEVSDDDEDQESDYGVSKTKTKRAAAGGGNKRKQRKVEADDGSEDNEAAATKPIVSESRRPIRSTRTAVSYKERDESEKEALLWEKRMEQKSDQDKKRKSLTDSDKKAPRSEEQHKLQLPQEWKKGTLAKEIKELSPIRPRLSSSSNVSAVEKGRPSVDVFDFESSNSPPVKSFGKKSMSTSAKSTPVAAAASLTPVHGVTSKPKLGLVLSPTSESASQPTGSRPSRSQSTTSSSSSSKVVSCTCVGTFPSV
jgi:hypothetical protein